MIQAFNKLKMYKKVKQNLISFMRTTEVTVNKTDGSYNQRIDVLLCGGNKYFRGSENYISQNDWTELW